MKTPTFLIIAIFITLFTVKSYAQKVKLNETTIIYEYSHVKEFTSDMKSRLDLFSNKMKELNYSDISHSENDIKGESFFSKIITGTALEIHYQSFIQFKEGRYKLTINKFAIKDQRYGTMPLENLRKKSQQRWIELINEKLPEIIKNLENTDDW
tara:strand:- start:4465 stop:4926 length:462 start_codon:yes stop_codon:yes gene_type:complete